MYSVSYPTDNTPDDPFFGFREFWRKSFGGAYLADYENGLTLGQADLDANATTNFDALKAVPHADRDDHWNAQVDGYSYATFKARGSNELRRGMP